MTRAFAVFEHEMLTHATVDPEMKKEFEEHQKASPLASGLTSGNPMGGFDMAAWMAGSSKGGEASKSSGVQESGGGGKARRRG